MAKITTLVLQQIVSHHLQQQHILWTKIIAIIVAFKKAVLTVLLTKMLTKALMLIAIAVK